MVKHYASANLIDYCAKKASYFRVKFSRKIGSINKEVRKCAIDAN